MEDDASLEIQHVNLRFHWGNSAHGSMRVRVGMAVVGFRIWDCRGRCVAGLIVRANNRNPGVTANLFALAPLHKARTKVVDQK